MASKRRKPPVRRKPAKAKSRPKAKKPKKRLSKAELAALKRFKKRSRAAKKGHATRKLKAEIRESVYRVRNVERDLGILADLNKPIEILKEPSTQEEYIAYIKAQQDKLEGYKDLVGGEWVRDDESMGKYRSGLRLLPEEIQLKLRKRMDRAHEKGTLFDIAYAISAEYEVPIKEVYTLWYSP